MIWALATHTYNPSYLCRLRSRGPLFEANRRKYLTKSHFQINQSKKGTGGVAQAVEYLLCKCKALSPKPSYPPPQKNYRKYEIGKIF
jgi:hypothetical protein